MKDQPRDPNKTAKDPRLRGKMIILDGSPTHTKVVFVIEGVYKRPWVFPSGTLDTKVPSWKVPHVSDPSEKEPVIRGSSGVRSHGWTSTTVRGPNSTRYSGESSVC